MQGTQAVEVSIWRHGVPGERASLSGEQVHMDNIHDPLRESLSFVAVDRTELFTA